MTLEHALILDLFIVTACIVLLSIKGGLRHSHPAVLYIGFHLLTFSLRAWGVLNGAITYLGATTAEISRALNYADVFLICATLGWLTVARRPEAGASPARSSRWAPIRGDYIAWVSLVCIPVGLVTLTQYAFLPTLNQGPVQADTSYKTLAMTWPALALSALMYKYGYRWFFVTPMVGYLLLIALQGQGRYRLVLPCILLAQIYLDRRRRRWPNMRVLGVVALMFLAFFPLKDIGHAYREGADSAQIRTIFTESISGTLHGQDKGQGILDEFAIVLTLVDQHGSYFYGRPYLNVLTLPIPRPLWPDKPGLADHIQAISTPGRPLGTNGAVVTVPGDLYLNFGLLGIAIGGFLIARVWVRLHNSAYFNGYGSVQHFAYLLLAAAAIQVLRDGLISVVTFVVVKNLPLLAMLLLHRRRSGVENAAPASQDVALEGTPRGRS